MSDGNFKRVRVTQVVDRHWEQIGRDDEHNVARPVFCGLFLERNKLSVDTKRHGGRMGKEFRRVFILHKRVGCAVDANNQRIYTAQLNTSESVINFTLPSVADSPIGGI